MFTLLFFAVTLVTTHGAPVYAVSMIVRDEIKILPRLFNSLHPHVACYEICDTGSTDGTPEWIQRWLTHQKPGVTGEVHHHPWVNFGANRNACLLALRQRIADKLCNATHILLPDADFELVVLDEKGFREKGPNATYNYVEYVGGPTFHSQPLVIDAASPCGYLGTTHEYLVCTDTRRAYNLLMGQPMHTTKERLVIEASHRSPASPSSEDKQRAYGDIAFRHHFDGYNRQDKFERDIHMLTEEIQLDPESGRAWFYLAQSLENAKRYIEAFYTYQAHLSLETIPLVDRWFSLYHMGACLVQNGTSIEEVARFFVDAYDMLPSRREPLFPLVRLYRRQGKFTVAKMYGVEALRIPFPRTDNGSLFMVEKWLYEWAFVDEVSICLHELGDNKGAARLLGNILNTTKITLTTIGDDDRKRLENNLEVFLKK